MHTRKSYLIVALSAALCLVAQSEAAQAQETVRGLMAASQSCDLQPEPSQVCGDQVIFLSGELEFRGAGRIEAVSVDADGVFEASLPQGSYRISLRKLRVDGRRLNPRNFKLSKRTIKANSDEPTYLAVRHRSRPLTNSPGIGF